jgi:predicted nucleotidyltransferase
MILHDLQRQNIITPPKWIPDNTKFLGVTGSTAYGMNTDGSDLDVHGYAIPHKEMIFPHLAGNIPNFGTQSERFRVYQQHHVKTLDGQKEYDFCIYNIVDFFNLAMQSNPNCLELLFLPRRCIIHTSHLHEHVLSHRHLFLSKKVMAKLRGYAYGQLNKAKNKTEADGKRAEDIAKHGYSTKQVSHALRLVLQAEQILSECDLDLERNSQFLASIRRGEWTLERAEKWFEEKEKSLETLYANSSLPAVADEARIKQLLMECLEMYFGNLDTVISKNPSMEKFIDDLENLMNRYRPLRQKGLIKKILDFTGTRLYN